MGTAVLSGRAAIDAQMDILEETAARKDSLTGKEKFLLTWRHFIAPATLGALTVTCVIGSNAISTRRAAALASAFALSEKAFSEFREKAVESLTKPKEQKIYDDIAEDRIKENPPQSNTLVVQGTDVPCYDVYSDRYFVSSAEKLRKAQNDINAQCINDMYASHNEFYHLIGLPGIPAGEAVGWTTDNMLDLRFTTVLNGDQPVLAVNYTTNPKENYHKIW